MAEESQKPSGVSDAGIDPKLGGLLAYLLGWVGGLIFYLISKDPGVKFHGMQSIILGVAVFVIGVLLMLIPFVNLIGLLLWPGYVILSIVLAVKAYNGQRIKLPVIGDMAERYAK